MGITAAELAGVLLELQQIFVQKRVQQIYQPTATSYELEFRGPGETRIFYISTRPQFARVHTLSKTLPHPPTPSASCMALRKHLGGAVLEQIEQIHQDRHLKLSFQTKEGQRFFYLELFSRFPNGILTSTEGMILDCLHPVWGGRRPLHPGIAYLFPPAPAVPKFSEPTPISLEELEKKYFDAEENAESEQVYRRLERQFQKEREQLEKLKQVLEKQLEVAENHHEYLQWGELLKAGLFQLKKGETVFRAVNYYAPDLAEIEIPLDAMKTPEENMLFYFKKYHKMKRGQEVLMQRLEELEAREKTLAQQEKALQEKTLPALFEKDSFSTPSKKLDLSGVSQPREYWSRDHFKILVGRSSTQNDELTMKRAKGNDLFMHVQGFPGSHVIIAVPKGKSVPLDTLLDGAALAKYFSKAREHQKSTVNYCFRKYVRKAKKAKPGAVYLQEHKSLFIEEDRPRLERLWSSGTEPLASELE